MLEEECQIQTSTPYPLSVHFKVYILTEPVLREKKTSKDPGIGYLRIFKAYGKSKASMT